jgi:hypothetical protein
MKPWIALLVAAPLTLGAVGAATLLSADTATAPVDNSLKIVNHPYVATQNPDFDGLLGYTETKLRSYLEAHGLGDRAGIVGCGEIRADNMPHEAMIEICSGRVTGLMIQNPDGSVHVIMA